MRKIRLVVCLILFPLTIWYAIVVMIRNLLYDKRMITVYQSKIKTIGVGNLIMGGSGKTPHTEWLLRKMGQTRQTALLSRGYGRKTSGFILANNESDAAEIGDEPAMIHRKFPEIITAVCEKRAEGLTRLEQLPGPPELVVMDDVYQHRQVQPDISILLTEYGHPWCDDHILPFGNLRETRRGSKRADIVIVTKCPNELGTEERQRFRRRLRLRDSQKLYFSSITYDEPATLFDEDNTIAIEELDEVLLVTGIAHPEPLVQHLEKKTHVTALRFGDHHEFSDTDIQAIVKQYKAIAGEKKAIATTEKDAPRLMQWEGALKGISVITIPVRVEFLGDEPQL